MTHPAATRPRFTRQGPKRLRRIRRDYGYGQISMWDLCETHFAREREAKLLAIREREEGIR